VQSEIPQIQVVTAIADAESEDYLSQLLFSQGWSIVFRAFDFEGLIEFLEARGHLARTILIYKTDLPGLDLLKLESRKSPTSTIICIDGVPNNAHLLMTQIRSQLRLPLIATPTRNLESAEVEKFAGKISHKPQRITVTGTTGAPGRSIFAINFACYLAHQKKVNLVDADMRSNSLAYFAGRSDLKNSNLEIATMDSKEKPVGISHMALADLAIFDIGALPPLDEVVTDRRWQAGLINSILEETSTLIYMCKSTGLSLIRLETFMNQFPILIRKLPIIYLLNQSGNTREDRALERRFATIVGGESHFVLPLDSKANYLFSTPGKRNSAFAKEIGKIANIISNN
jgi:CobQ/CobB/MinD/ParA nucleotide binding domain